MINSRYMKIFVRLKKEFWFQQKDIENITYYHKEEFGPTYLILGFFGYKRYQI